MLQSVYEAFVTKGNTRSPLVVIMPHAACDMLQSYAILLAAMIKTVTAIFKSCAADFDLSRP